MVRIAGWGLGILLLTAVAAAAANVARIAPFELPDQDGKVTAVAASDRNTLLVFYRGDW